jgi:hypothetical protein
MEHRSRPTSGFIRREDAERFIAEVRGDESELATYLRIDERKLDAGALN